MEYPSVILSLGPWNWLIFGGLLILLELIVPGTFLMFVGLAACAVGLVALNMDLTWQMQWLLFSIFAVIGVGSARFLLGSNFKRVDDTDLNTGAKRLLGQNFIVAEAIKNGRGKIRVADTLWHVNGPDLPEGEMVTVVRTDGTALFVEKTP